MTPDKDAEIARLRRELEFAIEAARENGKERDELARQLGAEVATTQRLRAAMRGLFATLYLCPHNNTSNNFCRGCRDWEDAEKVARVALASGNGDGK